MNHYVRSFALLLVATLFGLTLAEPTFAAKPHGCDRCPKCSTKVCRPEPTKEKEEKYCWEVECKEICIPHFKWPWAPCCEPPKCGRVRTVKVLEKKEYECEKCRYKWEIVDCGCKPAGCTEAAPASE